MRIALLSPFAAVVLAGAALAQGADDCSNAQVITGVGPHAFDNTNATLDGPADCSGQPVRKDVWFKWTAPQSGGYIFSTCGTSSMPMRVGVYDDQACPVSLPPVACATSGCGDINGARLPFPTVGGQTYLLRVGSKQVGVGGSGTFVLEFDDCYIMPDDSFEENDECAAAVGMDNGSYPALKVAKADPDWYLLDVAAGSTVTCDVFFQHFDGDLDLYLFDGCSTTQLDSSTTTNNTEHVEWLNDSGACRRVALKVEHFIGDDWGECNNYDLTIAGADTFGSCADCETVFCDANPNQEGNLGISTCSLAGLPILEMTGSTNGLFAYHLVGAGSGVITDPPGAIGDLCLGGAQIGRYVADVGAVVNGDFSTDLIGGNTGGGVGNLPNPPGGILTAGQTWNFQTWVRVPSSSRFSPALSVTFTP